MLVVGGSYRPVTVACNAPFAIHNCYTDLQKETHCNITTAWIRMINGNIEVCLYSLILSDSLLNSPVGKVQIERCLSSLWFTLLLLHRGRTHWAPKTNNTTAQYIFVSAAITCFYSHCASSAVTTDSKCAFDLILLRPAAVVRWCFQA